MPHAVVAPVPPPAAAAVLLDDDYRILSYLGRGHFGSVSLALDIRSQRRVALKLFDLQRADIAQAAAQQVRRERQLQSAVQHPNVLRSTRWLEDALYSSDTGQQLHAAVIVMEPADGGDLFDWLLSGAFEEPLARTYFAQLIDGLLACHRAGFAHRDIKPENLLLNAQHVLMLADFGSTRAVSTTADGLMQTFTGTPKYNTAAQHSYSLSPGPSC